jgi:hypothetical protein
MTEVTQTQTVAYRGFTIRAGMQAGEARANVFREGVQGLRHHAKAATVDAAVETAKAWIDELHTLKAEGRTRIGDQVVGSQADFEDALMSVRIGAAPLQMLKAHYRAPAHMISALGLARAAGYKDHATANMHYGKLGREISEAAGLSPIPSVKRRDHVFWTGVLASDAGQPDERGHLQWQMHDALARALEKLNMV